MSLRTLRDCLKTVQAHLDLRPLLLLAVMYGVIAFLPFGIFGWLQNEDGLMEWGSVALLILSAINAFRLQKQSQQGWERLGWLILFVLCCLFIGEEISWGERLHGAGIDAIRAINTQGETNLHNIAAFQGKGLLHLGWAGLGLVLGLGGVCPQPHASDPRQALHPLLHPARDLVSGLRILQKGR